MILIHTQRLGEHRLAEQATDGDFDGQGRQKDWGTSTAVQVGELPPGTSEKPLLSLVAIRPEAEPCRAEAARFLPVAPANTCSTIPNQGMIAGFA
jgi:hypothetical protein